MASLSYVEVAIPIEAFVEPSKNPASPKVSLRTGGVTHFTGDSPSYQE
jgi:hypothetical protein